VDERRVPGTHRWLSTTPDVSTPFTIEPDPLSGRKRIGVPFSGDIARSPSLFAVTRDSKIIFTCGHWDSSFRSTWVDTSRRIQCVRAHKDIVTCMTLSPDGSTLITGSRDTTLIVWELQNYTVPDTPSHILYGHSDAVTACALSTGLDVCVSGAKDSAVIVHSLKKGRYIRSLSSYAYLRMGGGVGGVMTGGGIGAGKGVGVGGKPITTIRISNRGHIIVYSEDDLSISLYTINGRLLKSLELSDRIHDFVVTSDSEYMVCGGNKKTIYIRSLHDFTILHRLRTDSVIRSLGLSSDEREVFAGLQDGKLLIIALDQQKLEQKYPELVSPEQQKQAQQIRNMKTDPFLVKRF